MALQPVVGAGLWLPSILPFGYSNSNFLAVSDGLTLDADEEEAQLIGSVMIDGGGSKTFGTSGSKLDWLPGATITFASGSTLRVGVKKAASIDATVGPPARATIGAAAFDVYQDLVGGTDTIASTTARSDAMASGTPFTVTQGDLLAICFHLDSSSGTPNVKIRMAASSAMTSFPTATLVTSGPTYTLQNVFLNSILTFDDGTLGWLEPTFAFSVVDVASATIGNTNIYGNIFRVPFPCQIDALAAVVQASNAGNFALDFYTTPLGTPTLVDALTHDANIVSISNALRMVVRTLPTPRTLVANTDYAIGVRQTTATAVLTIQRDVAAAAHFKSATLGAECYAANSAAGATFAAQNSGRRRYSLYARLSAFDNGQGIIIPRRILR